MDGLQQVGPVAGITGRLELPNGIERCEGFGEVLDRLGVL